MSKKPRENRVPIMMSDEELKAIDDWRFENRVATRSDAIRRLCRIGVAADEQADNIATTLIVLFKKLPELASHKHEFYKNIENGSELIEEINNYMDKSGNTNIEIATNIQILFNIMGLIIAPIKAYRANENLEEAQSKSEMLQDAIYKKMELLEKEIDKLKIPSDKKSIYVNTKKT